MKYLFNIDNVLCTLFLFLIIFILSRIAINFSALDPLEQALIDFEFSDIAFSRIKDPPPADTNIVLVNIGSLGRKDIAEEINIINQYKPKVIGIDAFFRKPKDSTGDSLLSLSLSKVKNLVMVSQLDSVNDTIDRFDTLEKSNAMFTKYAKTGFANFITGDNDGFRSTRTFSPKENVADSTEVCFTAKIAQIVDLDAYKRLMKRNNKNEVINWCGGYKRFYSLDVNDVFSPDANLKFLKDKIVLMGYMGEPLGKEALEDAFFTPMNVRYAGRTFPDMYGVVVHANVLSQILKGDYIFKFPKWLNYLIAFFIAYLNVTLFLFITKKIDDYFDLLTRAIQIAEAVLFLLIVLYLLSYYNIKIDLSFSILVAVLSGDLVDVYNDTLKTLYFRYKDRVLKFVRLKK